MNLRRFSLKPFRKEDRPDIGISGTIRRRADALHLGCTVFGDLSKVVLPAPEKTRERRDRLWEETCLELFLAEKDSPRYWEFNLSPAGPWNVYRFTSYRKGMEEEPARTSLPFRVRTDAGNSLRLALDLEFGTILPPGKAIEVAVCAVLRTATGGISHWALAHPGPRPDFHNREGFTLAFPAG